MCGGTGYHGNLITMGGRRIYLGIIPARAGSKRLRGKNLLPLAGKPLLSYSIEAALASKRLTHVVLSTDSVEIADYARSLGVDPQGLRPGALARDDSPVTAALLDALTSFERGHPPAEAVVLLQPTSPFRRGRHIDEAIRIFEARGADTVTSVRAVKDHPYWAWVPAGAAVRPYHTLRKMALQRGDLPPAYVENGAVFVSRRSLVMRGTIYGRLVVPFVMDELDSIDIDTPLDLAWAEFVAAHRRSLARK